MKRQDKKLACHEQNRRVYVAMSGGVDSSVAAALLKKRGFNVIGVFMKPWSPNQGTMSRDQGAKRKRKDSVLRFGVHCSLLNVRCLWKQDREDAMRVASILGIPFKTWDFSKKYKKSVADYMVREYKIGRTPNPDVMCNKEIKFGLFFDKAMKEGADHIATGHYVRLKRNEQEAMNREHAHYSLFTAHDSNKDQSYFLWTLKQKQLAKCLFPIGEYLKPEVRKMAKKFGLPNHDKKDSQGVCFVGSLNMKSFLKTRIKLKNGEIRLLKFSPELPSRLNLEGSSVIGTHDGAYYYTIGQRHGLNIGIGGGPYYIVSKDIKKNIIYVGKEKDLYSKQLKVSNISWISDDIIPHFFSNEGHLRIDVKIRYRSKSEKAILSKNGTLKFFKPVRAITSGQSAVFYKNGELLGGGIIS